MTPPSGLKDIQSIYKKMVDIKWSHNRVKHDFPRKEKVDTNANGCIPTDWKTILTKEHIEDAGKVTDRLNRHGKNVR